MWPRRAALISRARALLFVGIGSGAMIATACGLATSGTGENVGEHPLDATTAADATTSSDDGSTFVDGSIFPTDAGGADAMDAADATDGYDSGPPINCDGVYMASCATCAGKPTACSATGTCVAECAADCPGSRVACFRCFGGGAIVQGSCEVENDAGYCMNGNYGPGAACPCDKGDASTCPGDYQRCMTPDGGPAGGAFACHSCGEPNTKGPACKNGKACDLGGNATDHLTCH